MPVQVALQTEDGYPHEGALDFAATGLDTGSIAAFSGMLASTCLAVLLVPSFFVILQRWQERRKLAAGTASAAR